MNTIYKITFTRDNKQQERICETLADVAAEVRSLVYNTDVSRKTGNKFGTIEEVNADLYKHHGDGYYTLIK